MTDIFNSSANKEDLTLTETPKDTPAVVPTNEIPSLKGFPPKALGLLSYFKMHPVGVKFENQEDDETIVLFLRRHFFTNVSWILLTIFFLIAPVLVVALFQITDFSLFTIPPRLLAAIILFYYLVISGYALMQFVVWFYHVGIVTQKRLLDLDVYNILNHHLAETDIDEIVDVSYMQQGFFQSFFDYGDVPIQTKAVKANFEFEEAPHPAQVSDIITDLRKEPQAHA
jgi:hypothetical protein